MIDFLQWVVMKFEGVQIIFDEKVPAGQIWPEPAVKGEHRAGCIRYRAHSKEDFLGMASDQGVEIKLA